MQGGKCIHVVYTHVYMEKMYTKCIHVVSFVVNAPFVSNFSMQAIPSSIQCAIAYTKYAMGVGTNSMKAKAYSVLWLPYRYNMECAIRMQAISGSIQCAISYTQYNCMQWAPVQTVWSSEFYLTTFTMYCTHTKHKNSKQEIPYTCRECILDIYKKPGRGSEKWQKSGCIYPVQKEMYTCCNVHCFNRFKCKLFYCGFWSPIKSVLGTRQYNLISLIHTITVGRIATPQSTRHRYPIQVTANLYCLSVPRQSHVVDDLNPCSSPFPAPSQCLALSPFPFLLLPSLTFPNSPFPPFPSPHSKLPGFLPFSLSSLPPFCSLSSLAPSFPPSSLLSSSFLQKAAAA